MKRRHELEGRPVILELLSFRAEDLKGQTWEAADQTLMLVYSFLERRCGISIQAVTDRLRAMPCPKGVALDLGIAPGHSVLAITRVGLDLRGNAIELRRSWVCTDAHEYVSELRWSAT